MRSIKGRGLALLLALVLVLGLLPGAAFAAGGEVTVYVSAARDGEFLPDKNGEAVAYVPVTVPEESATIGEVFQTLHRQYYAQGEAGYETAQGSWGEYVVRFWGLDASAAGYCYDHAYASGLSDPVSEGGYLCFWFYQDGGYSDQYVYFDAGTAGVSGGEALVLTLRGADGEVPGAVMTADGQALAGRTTDGAGQVTLYFPKAGEYLLSAQPGSAGEYFVPPVCRVTVTGDDPDAAGAVAGDKEALTLPGQAAEDLTLPLVGESGKSAITWSSSAPGIIDSQGRVTRGTEEETVILTARLTYGDERQTKEFTLTVPPLGEEEILDRAAAALSGGLEPSQWNEDFTAPGDTNIVPVAQRAVDGAVSGVQVEPSVTSSRTASIGTDGSIIYGSRAQTVTVTFTLSLGGESRAAECEVTVPRAAQTRQSVMDAVTREVLGEAILKDNASLDSVTGDLNFTSLSGVLGYCIKAAWTVPGEAEDCLDARYGDVTRPACGEQDAAFSLSVTLSWDTAMDPYMGYVGPVPEDKSFTYPVTVRAITGEEYEQAAAEVDEALAAYDPASIAYADNSSREVDLDAVTGTLNLQGISGLTCRWTTEDPAVVEAPLYNTGRAEVHRPAVGQPDARCVLTLTAEKYGYSSSRTVTVTVKAVEQEELDAQQAYMDAVEAALTFSVIKKDNLRDQEVTGSLQMVYRGLYDSGTGEVTWKTSNTGSEGIQITWESSLPGVVASYGTVTRPAADTQVVLTATLHSPLLSDYVADRQVDIPVTVLADGQIGRVDALLEGIAAGYVDSSSEWVVLDMAAYGAARPETQFKTSNQARQAYIDQTIQTLAGGDAGEQAYSKTILVMQSIGADPRQLYPAGSDTPLDAVEALKGMDHSASAWSAPYTLAAFNQGDYGSQAAEQALLDRLLASQSENGCWEEYGTIDTTANVIAALSFYYDADEAVRRAVDRAVDYLSGQQKATGVYDDGNTGEFASGDNANSTAMVVIALASLGIDPDTDPRFVKEGGSLLDGLLSFALADNSGFGYTDNSQVNPGATEQAFRALVAASRVLETGAACHVYDFSGNPVEPVRAAGGGEEGETPVSPPSGGGSITVYFTLKGDTGDWVSRKAVSVSKGATVYQVFTAALRGTGITYTSTGDGYVSTVTKDGRTLGEFSSGSNSGWLYKVNGQLPQTGAGSYTVSAGDEVIWYYTADWTADPDAGGVSPFPSGEAKVEQAADGTYRITIPQEADGPVLVTIPDVGTGKLLVIVRADGMEEAVKKSVAADGMARLLLEESAVIRAVDYVSAFDDVARESWYAGAVDFVSGRGLLAGVGQGCFAPGATLTRGMAVTVLHALENPQTGNWESLFSDVAEDAWYAQSASWALDQGIACGYGDGLFGPEDPVTREQLAVMLRQYAGVLGLDTGAGEGLEEYPDSRAVSPWAEEAVAWAVDRGIIAGREDGRLDPGGLATRAEAAAMVYRLVEWMLGA